VPRITARLRSLLAWFSGTNSQGQKILRTKPGRHPLGFRVSLAQWRAQFAPEWFKIRSVDHPTMDFVAPGGLYRLGQPAPGSSILPSLQA